jgi:hypothetical protein
MKNHKNNTENISIVNAHSKEGGVNNGAHEG